LVYDNLIPADSKMLIALGEVGPSDATYRGTAQVINDLNGYETRLRDDPDVVMYGFWCVGGDGGGPRPDGFWHFAYSTLDDSLPDVLQWTLAGR
jgi:hypothetical protein